MHNVNLKIIDKSTSSFIKDTMKGNIYIHWSLAARLKGVGDHKHNATRVKEEVKK